MPPFLADSLPDAWGNELFEQWRRQQGIKLGEITPLDKLAFIGRRAMGALEFFPETSSFSLKEDINLKALVNLAEKIYAQQQPQANTAPNGAPEGGTTDNGNVKVDDFKVDDNN